METSQMPQVQYPIQYALQLTVHAHMTSNTYSIPCKAVKVQHAHTYGLKNVSIVSDLVMSSASSCLKLFKSGVDALLDVRIGHQQH